MRKSAETVFLDLYQIACAAQKEIYNFRPDLLMVLANGGWAPYHALKALWDETSPEPFPPVLVTNLGREKIERFQRILDNTQVSSTYLFVGEYSSCKTIGYLMHWLTYQDDWLHQISAQFETALGKDISPKRILVLDDMYHEGTTYLLTVGLLKALYPDMEVHYFAGGGLSWRVRIAKMWFLRHNWEFPEDVNYEINSALYKIVPGTEDDGDEDSFFWRPITIEHPCLQTLSKYLPAEKWLELPKEMYRLIEEKTRMFARRGEIYEEKKPSTLCFTSKLAIEIYLYQFIWERGWITDRLAAKLLNISITEANNSLNQLVNSGDFLIEQKGKTIHYKIAPSLNNYYPGLIMEVVWPQQDEFMIGSIPFIQDIEEMEINLNHIMNEGVDQIFYLRDKKLPDQLDYAQALEQISIKIKRPAIFSPVHFPEKRPPSKRQMTALLDALDEALAAGHVIYLHHRSNYDCTYAVAGCWLVRHGMSGENALAKLDKLRKNTCRPWLTFPKKKSFLRMIKTWEIGQ